MITLKSEREMAIMDRCNALVLQVLAELTTMIRPGCDVADLDAYAEERTREAIRVATRDVPAAARPRRRVDKAGG